MIYYFTFPMKDEARRNKFVKLEGTAISTREQMVQQYGTEWSMQYTETEFAGQVEQFGLTELK